MECFAAWLRVERKQKSDELTPEQEKNKIKLYQGKPDLERRTDFRRDFPSSIKSLFFQSPCKL